MATLSPDTPPDIEQLPVERLREMPAWRNVALLTRRQLHLLSEDPDWCSYLASAEDTRLSKLEWYRLGDRLDRDYMRRMAAGLYVQDLLERAFVEVGGL